MRCRYFTVFYYVVYLETEIVSNNERPKQNLPCLFNHERVFYLLLVWECGSRAICILYFNRGIKYKRSFISYYIKCTTTSNKFIIEYWNYCYFKYILSSNEKVAGLFPRPVYRWFGFYFGIHWRLTHEVCGVPSNSDFM